MKNMILLATVTLAACSAFADNTTNYSVCNTGPQATTIERSWKFEQQEQGIQFSFVLAIGSNSVTATNTCSLGGRSLAAAVTSVSIHDARSLTIQSTQSKAESSDDGAGNTLNCNVSVQAGTTPYELRGACLVMKDPASGAELVLIPAN